MNGMILTLFPSFLDTQIRPREMHFVAQEHLLSRQNVCGIVAYCGNDECAPFLMEGLHILENRGYDSAGISSLRNGTITTTKYASIGTTSDALDRLETHLNVLLIILFIRYLFVY